jgi:hypothetical protein
MKAASTDSSSSMKMHKCCSYLMSSPLDRVVVCLIFATWRRREWSSIFTALMTTRLGQRDEYRRCISPQISTEKTVVRPIGELHNVRLSISFFKNPCESWQVNVECAQLFDLTLQDCGCLLDGVIGLVFSDLSVRSRCKDERHSGFGLIPMPNILRAFVLDMADERLKTPILDISLNPAR